MVWFVSLNRRANSGISTITYGGVSADNSSCAIIRP